MNKEQLQEAVSKLVYEAQDLKRSMPNKADELELVYQALQEAENLLDEIK